MIGTTALNERIQVLLAADNASLSAATALHIHLIKDPFTADVNADFTAMTEADFDGYAPLDATVGDAQTFTDPLTRQMVMQLGEPLGGWHWDVTGATNLPQNIYGWAVTDTADAVTWGSGLFDAPLQLLAINDGVDIGQIRWEIVLTPLV